MVKQQIKHLGNIFQVQKVAESFLIDMLCEDQDASGTHRSLG